MILLRLCKKSFLKWNIKCLLKFIFNRSLQFRSANLFYIGAQFIYLQHQKQCTFSFCYLQYVKTTQYYTLISLGAFNFNYFLCKKFWLSFARSCCFMVVVWMLVLLIYKITLSSKEHLFHKTATTYFCRLILVEKPETIFLSCISQCVIIYQWSRNLMPQKTTQW